MGETLSVNPVRLSSQLVSLLDAGTNPIDKVVERENDRRKVWNTLVRYVPRSGFTPPVDRPTQVLEIACGIGEMSHVISAYFGGGNFDGQQTGRTHYTGIDINDAVIDKAKKEYESPGHVFVQGDATKLDETSEIPSQADVVIIRHQHYRENPKIWTEIINQGLQRLSQDGIIIFTSYEKDENNDMVSLIPKLDGYLVINSSNEESPSRYQWRDFASDRYIIIARKKIQKESVTDGLDAPLVVGSGK